MTGKESSFQLPADLDNYLKTEESRYPDIIPGTEKRIIWEDPTQKSTTEFSFVYLHGYSASRQEISPVPESIAKHFRGNLFLTRLTGHGRPAHAMSDISLDALLRDANEALTIGKRLGNKVVLMGNSTGATLATWLALQDHPEIFSLILLSPNFALKRKSARVLTWPGAKLWLRTLQGDTYCFTPENAEQQKYWTTCYPSQALIPLQQLLRLVQKMPLENIRQATQVLYCPDDQVVDIQAMKNTVKRFRSPVLELQTIAHPDSSKRHVLGGYILSPSTTTLVIERICSFLGKIKTSKQITQLPTMD